jgi:hypothetical protein
VSDETLDNVVALPYATDEAIPGPVEVTSAYACSHPFVVLDSASHRVICDERRCVYCGSKVGCRCVLARKGCGKEVDPWEWINRITRDWRNFTRRFNAARKQAEAAEARLAELERRERNAKERVRRAEAKLG